MPKIKMKFYEQQNLALDYNFTCKMVLDGYLRVFFYKIYNFSFIHNHNLVLNNKSEMDKITFFA